MSHPSSPKFTWAWQPPGLPCQARMGCLPQAPPFRAARWLPGPPCPPSSLLAPTIIIGTLRGRLAHGVRSLLEIPLRKAPCEGGRQTDICGVTFTDRQIIARRKPPASAHGSSDWSHTGRCSHHHVPGAPGAGRALHSGHVGLLAECLTPLRALADKGCHTPGRDSGEGGPLHTDEPGLPREPLSASQGDKVGQVVLRRWETNVSQRERPGAS